MIDTLLQFLLDYGALGLLPIIVGASIGVPLPASLLLLAAGGFAGGGQLEVAPLLVAAYLGALAGDGVGYWLGRRGGRAAVERWGGRLSAAPAVLARAERHFARWGGLSVFLTRFLLTPFGASVNLLAGAARYQYRSFLLYDALGEAIWVGGYVGLGYAFSANWDVLADFLGSGTLLISLLVVVLVVGVLLVRTVRGQGRAVAARRASEPPAPAHGFQAAEGRGADE